MRARRLTVLAPIVVTAVLSSGCVLKRSKGAQIYVLDAIAPARPAGLVWFGPRRPALRYDKTWNIADTMLPMAPSALVAAPR